LHGQHEQDEHGGLPGGFEKLRQMLREEVWHSVPGLAVFARFVLQHVAEFADFVLGKFFLLDEMGEHGLERAAEDETEKRFAGGVHTILLGDERAIEIGAAFLAEAEGFLFDEAVEESLDGLGMPARVAAGKGLDDLAGGTGAERPDGLHDLPFGFGNARGMFHIFRLRL